MFVFYLVCCKYCYKVFNKYINNDFIFEWGDNGGIYIMM